MHAIAETVNRLRARPGTFGLVGANGGTLSKYSVGIYSTAPAPWRADRSAELQADIDAWPTPEQAAAADGWATIETYTVKHGHNGERTGVVIGRLEADARRFVAMTQQGDEEILGRLGTAEPIGTRVYVRSFGFGNRVTTDQARMNELFPPRPKVLRENYEHVSVRRDGHLLEITINRPEVRNSLHPPANEELDEIFDAYFADPDLWVAILTGAGDKAFSAGNDLVYSASGKSVWSAQERVRRADQPPGYDETSHRRGQRFRHGGGCEIALACHLIVADETATFALSEVKVGLAAGAGGLVRLPRAIPAKLANEMILTGKRITAAEARSYGLVNRVVAPVPRWREPARWQPRFSTAAPLPCAPHCRS